MRIWIMRRRRWVPLLVLGLGVAVAVPSTASPWPTHPLIRGLFEYQASKTLNEMRPYAPTTGVDEVLDVTYSNDGTNTTFESFSPSDLTGALPTVELNYTVAPEAIYPTALGQLNDAVSFLVAHAADHRIDPDRIVLAGDSAGSQFAEQLATMVTSPVYAATVGIQPALTPKQLRAVVLNCGIYDVSGIPNAPGLGGVGVSAPLCGLT